MIYGHIPGVEIGTTWLMRIEVNHAGIHRPTVAGIHPGPEGAYSIALSGGYEDDIDLGDCFTYTGEGGRDLKGTKANPKNLRTAAQSKDQSLSRGNKALIRSNETGLPVRVLRGYKLDSPFAPDEGYRYDGLYTVEKWWYTTGLAGFGVYKFALQRRADQPPPPWHFKEDMNEKKGEADNVVCKTKSKDGQELPICNPAIELPTSNGTAGAPPVMATTSETSNGDTVSQSCVRDPEGELHQTSSSMKGTPDVDSGISSQEGASDSDGSQEPSAKAPLTETQADGIAQLVDTVITPSRQPVDKLKDVDVIVDENSNVK
jgi:hypothetical protein